MGKVCLVGARPGDPELITLKDLGAIKEADVAPYDRLVNEEVLSYTSPPTKFFYCGRDLRKYSSPQEETNRTMATLARKGHIVTRLKGGGPLVFGRGREETEELVCHDIYFEIIPGITSEIAAPAYTGIPVTHRDYSSSITFVTAVNKPGMDKSKYWQHLANGPETLCIYMGVKRLSEICELLMQYGRSSGTPVAFVHMGMSKQQMTMIGTLDTIQERAHHIRNPAMIIVGEVVRMRERINWFVRQTTIQSETLTEMLSTQRIHLKKR